MTIDALIDEDVAPVTTVPCLEVRALIDDVLAPAAGEIADRLARVIHRHDAAPGDDAGTIADTLASCEANVRMQLAMWRNGQDPSHAEPPEAAIAYARFCAREDRSLADLLRIYHIGQEELMRIVRHELASRLPAETMFAALDQVCTFVFTYNDAVLVRLEEVHRRERATAARTTVARRRRMLAAILAGEPADPCDAADCLGYDVRRHHLGVVLWGAEPDRLGAEAARLASTLGTGAPLTEPLGGSALAAWFGGWEPPDPALVRPADGGVRIALGTVRPGVEGFRATHADALVARRVSRECRLADPAVDYPALALAGLLIADAERARTFVADELGALAGGERPDAMHRLRMTLETYFAELASVARTARRLGVHENTVSYRLQRVCEIRGRPLTERTLELQAALRLARLFSEPETDADLHPRCTER
ncbi:PucR family transcriptional regulator [Capillimicrobium parvum]|uniref:PucR family transcriptional regulator n=1 Tax=Capillimicrobium parvum TaxID=2884022 RepID=A0A9E6XWE6_9ACTN|nr:helix-turn-helix domain-containing protein [Capillimicrobium parvum]UGS35726.1 hypothetical protein DSM104329_02121 [Capillimicrobium parvum]